MKFLSIILVAVLLILDWAALDDITTGHEPNYFGEYVALGVSLLFFLLLGSAILRGKLHKIATP